MAWFNKWFTKWFAPTPAAAGDATASASFATITLTAITATATGNTVTPDSPPLSGSGNVSGFAVEIIPQPHILSLSDVSAAILSKHYNSTQELAEDITRSLASLSRQTGISRGLSRGVVTDIQGGTTLGIGDRGIANDSDVLVQNPQPGIPRNVGSGLRTRRQTRVESNTRTLPATVVTAAQAGDTTVRVRVSAEGVDKTRDSLTQSEVAGGLDISQGTEYDAAMTGQPIVVEGGNGIQPIEAGRTVQAVLTENWEVTTTHTTRNGRNIPVVTRVLKSVSAALVNGFAIKDNVCVPNSEIAPSNALITPDLGSGADWEITTVFDAEEGRAWGVIILPVDHPSGTIDMNSYGYYAYGVVPPPGGVISFTGLTQAYADANSQWNNYSAGLMNTPYLFALMVGCNQEQAVDYGTFTTPGSGDGYPPREWVITDSNFPDPL